MPRDYMGLRIVLAALPALFVSFAPQTAMAALECRTPDGGWLTGEVLVNPVGPACLPDDDQSVFSGGFATHTDQFLDDGVAEVNFFIFDGDKTRHAGSFSCVGAGCMSRLSGNYPELEDSSLTRITCRYGGDTGGDCNINVTYETDRYGEINITGQVKKDIGEFTNIVITGKPFGPGPAADIMIVSGGGQKALAGTDFTKPLVVKLTDTHGNPVPRAGYAITFASVDSGPGRPGLQNDSVTVSTDARGHASATVTANTIMGKYRVGAYFTRPAGEAVKYFFLSNVIGKPAALEIVSGNGQKAAVGADFPKPLVVQVTDAYGNAVSKAGLTVRFTALNGPAQGSKRKGGEGTAVKTDNAGRASMPVTANKTIGAYQITASFKNADGQENKIVFDLSNTAGPPANFEIVSGRQGLAAVGDDFANELIVRVTDHYGNPTPGAQVSFVTPSSGPGAFLSPRRVETGIDGLAAVSAKANTIIGSYEIAARVRGLDKTLKFEMTNTVGPPARLALVAGNGQSTRVQTAFSSPLVVALTDIHGNPVARAGLEVTFIVPKTGGGRPGVNEWNMIVPTDTDGQAAMTVAANAVPGSYQVIAQFTPDDAATAETVFSLTNIPGGEEDDDFRRGRDAISSKGGFGG